MKPTLWAGVFCVLISITAFAEVDGTIHHELVVTLEPSNHRIDVKDRITLTSEQPLTIMLHKNLAVTATKGQITQTPTAQNGATSPEFGAVPVTRYEIRPAPGEQEVMLHYSGIIHHPTPQDGNRHTGQFGETPGIVDTHGIYLAATSAWYPLALNHHVTFTLDVTLPPQWKAVSQGTRVAHDESGVSNRATWRETAPQEEIYLIAATFTEYEKSAGPVHAMAFLRQPDNALATRYLNVTAQYIEMYQQLIGPYPYGKFALVENFWETGYGMPSFTLLGPTVIRLPFILHSSYPHEILHNWWGNGVYVDYASGNWAEGLTSYLADHLIQQHQGRGAMFRRNILQGYADFVSESQDFPLTEFRARRSSSSEAIGYGKTQMVFHMLRQELGDDTFINGLQQLYRDNKFRTAGFSDVATAFGHASKRNLSGFFRHWVERTGAPMLSLKTVAATPTDAGWHISGVLAQQHAGEAYPLTVPIAVTLAGEDAAYQTHVAMTGKHQPFSLTLPARPLRLDVDPQFDLFRRLDRSEIPPALSQAFGAERALVVLPAQAPPQTLMAYQKLIKTWRQSQPHQVIDVVMDDVLIDLPEAHAIWLFGRTNRFRHTVLDNLADQPFHLSPGGLTLNDTEYSTGHSVVVTARAPTPTADAIVWLVTDNDAAIPGLARKLPRYRKYSYLAFEGDEPANIAKGQWSVSNSPMTHAFTETVTPRAALTHRAPLISAPLASGHR